MWGECGVSVGRGLGKIRGEVKEGVLQCGAIVSGVYV